MNATVWVTNVCTLACKYCYEGKKENVSMSMDTAMATVAFMKKMMTCDSKGTVRFHGGEPLMCRDIISIIIDRLESEYSDILSYGITTNALLIDNSISKWLADHFDNISVSIDGNEGTHDQNRVLKNGRGTFLEVQRGYRKLLKHGRKICARMTVTPNTCAHLTENICFLIEEGFQIIEPVPDIRPSVWDEDSFNVLQNAYYRIVDLQKRHKDLVEIRGLRAAMNALLAYVLMIFILLLRSGWIDRPIMNLCVMLAYVVYYALPTLFFFTSFASMLSFVTGDSRTAIPIFFVFMAASSLTLSTRNGQIIQNVFVSPLIINRAPFYSPLSETQACFEGINRIICVVLGVLFMRLSGRMNNHPKAVKTFLKTNWLHRKAKVSKRSASHFIWLNLKIVTSAFLVLSAAVLLLVPALFSSISHSTQIGTTLLGNVGWSAAVLFAGTYSVEYSHRTHDLMQLSKISRGRILFIRCLLNYLVLLVIMCAAYGILLYRLPTKVQTGVYPGLFTEFLITFTICALFFGVSAMTFSNYFKNTLLGVLFGLLMNAVLILFAFEPSIWNVYLYKAYYSQKDVSGTLLGASSVLYGILTAILFYVNCQITKRVDRV